MALEHRHHIAGADPDAGLSLMLDGSMQDFPLTLERFLDHAAKWHGDVEVVSALADGGTQRIGYAALADRARRVSTVLRSAGVAQGDRVATLAWNSAAHMAAWYGVMGMGAVCHTLNPRLTAEQLAAMLIQSEARLLIVSADLIPLAQRIAERLSRPVRLLAIDGDPDIAGESLDSLLADAAPVARWGGFAETIPSGLCFTSGTTGAPKGVTYTHRSSFLHTLRVLQADGMAVAGRDTVLAVVPMFHANAWGLPFAAPATGARLVLPGRDASGASLSRLIAAEGVTVGVGVPTVWLGVVEALEETGGTLPSLERIIVGGAPLPPALMQRIEERLGVIVQTSWGMTELSPSGTVAPPWLETRDAGLSGRPAIGVDLLLTDAAGAPLPEQRGAEGHLRVRGAAVVDRYFGQADSACDASGWFETGDLARIDAAGNLIITGRAKDLIKSGGEWINPAEIEAVVGSLPDVSLAAVIGRQDARWGERPILLVEMREHAELSDATMLDALRGRVASWWIPDAVVRLPAMPLAPTGKIDKSSLRARYGAAGPPGA